MSAIARFNASPPPAAPAAPQHVGEALHIGERVLMREPGSWHDLIVELRGVDDDLAAVCVRHRFEIVELSWLRRQ